MADPTFNESNNSQILGESNVVQSAAALVKEMSELKLEDHKWRIRARKRYAITFLLILAIQNLAVFILIYLSYFKHDLKDLSIVLSVLITGTLVETGYVIKIIIQWIFSNIDYKN